MKTRKKWLKRAVWILLTPILLFLVLMILLYVPPVQNVLRKQVTAMASEATGMDISVERIDLRFPLNLLVRGVRVIQPADPAQGQARPDTLLDLQRLEVRVQAWPLLKGRVEVDNITLSQVAVNSAGLVEGMRVKGVLGKFFLASHGIDLTAEDAILNQVELSDTHLQVELADMHLFPRELRFVEGRIGACLMPKADDREHFKLVGNVEERAYVLRCVLFFSVLTVPYLAPAASQS